MKLFQHKQHRLFMIGTLLTGFILRLIMVYVADTELRWDSQWYFDAARGILLGRWPAHCCFHGSGYPFVLSIFTFIFGVNSITVVQITQVVLDVVTGLLLALVMKRVSSSSAWKYVLMAYMVNPFSASFSGIVMSEVFSLFLVTLLVFFISSKQFFKKPLLWFVSGIVSAFLVLTKPGFIWFSISLALGMIAVIKRVRIFGKFLSVYISGFILVSLLGVMTYYNSYKEISITPPYTLSIGSQLYMTYYLEPVGEIFEEFRPMHPEWRRVQVEYHHLFLANKPELASWFNGVYTQKFLEQLPYDYPLLIKNVIRNTFHFWDKSHLFIYIDPFYPTDRWIVRIINIVYIMLFVYGFGAYLMQRKEKHTGLIYISCLLFLYIGAFPLISNVSRHSLPFYPVLILWAGYGVFFLKKGKKKSNN